MGKKTEQASTVTVPELLDLLKRTEERLALSEGRYRQARRPQSATRTRRDVILPLYCAVARLTSPAEAASLIKRHFHYRTTAAVKSALVRWKKQVRAERKRLERAAESGEPGDRALLSHHRTFVDTDFPIPNLGSIDKRS